MKNLVIATFILIVAISSHAQEYHLSSPDGFLRAKISISDNASVEFSERDELLLILDEIDLIATPISLLVKLLYL
jgi:hypothetical protein